MRCHVGQQIGLMQGKQLRRRRRERACAWSRWPNSSPGTQAAAPRACDALYQHFLRAISQGGALRSINKKFRSRFARTHSNCQSRFRRASTSERRSAWCALFGGPQARRSKCFEGAARRASGLRIIFASQGELASRLASRRRLSAHNAVKIRPRFARRVAAARGVRRWLSAWLTCALGQRGLGGGRAAARALVVASRHAPRSHWLARGGSPIRSGRVGSLWRILPRRADRQHGCTLNLSQHMATG